VPAVAALPSYPLPPSAPSTFLLAQLALPPACPALALAVIGSSAVPEPPPTNL